MRDTIAHRTSHIAHRTSIYSRPGCGLLRAKLCRPRIKVCSLYRPPGTTSLALDFEALDRQVQHVILSSSDPLLIIGDFNCDLCNSDSAPGKAAFINFMQSLSLHQFVYDLTFPRGNSLLDLIVSDRASLISDVQVSQCAYSDHSLVRSRIKISKTRAEPKFVLTRQVHKINVLDFHAALMAVDWSPVFACVGVADQWTNFTNLFLPVLAAQAPLRRLKLRNPGAPAASEVTLELMARRRGTLARDGRTLEFYDLNRRVRSAIRADVRQDIARRVNEQGPASTFRNISQIIEGKGSSRVVPEATPDQLNEFFCGGWS